MRHLIIEAMLFALPGIIYTMPPVVTQRLAAHVAKCLRRAHLTERRAAALLGISPEHFAAQLRGKEHLSLAALTRLPSSIFHEVQTWRL